MWIGAIGSMKQQIEIGLCDDDKLYIEHLKEKICNICMENMIEIKLHIYNSGEALVKEYTHLDLLFLDEELDMAYGNNLNGLEVKSLLNRLDSNLRIVFITSHQNIMADAFGDNVFGFIVKGLKDFDQRLEKYIMLFNETIYKDSQLTYISSYKHSVTYHFADGNQTIVVGSIGKIAEDLKNQRDIIRCHRTIIVNLCHVKYPNKDYSELILITGERIPVSRSKRKMVKDRLTHYTDYFFKLMEDE